MRILTAAEMRRKTELVMIATACLLAAARDLSSQTENLLEPLRTVSLPDVAASEWQSGLRPFAAVASGRVQYVLMLPTPSEGAYASLAVFSEDGTFIGSHRISANVRPTLGVDRNGNAIVFRQDSRSQGAVEVYSPSGTLVSETPITGSPSTVTTQEWGIHMFRAAASAPLKPPGPDTVEELSRTLFANRVPYVLAVLGNGSTVHLALTQPQITLYDAAGNVVATRPLDQAVLDRYGTRSKSTDPNVVYWDLSSAVVTPRGKLFALEAGVKVATGAIALEINPQTAAIDSVLRLQLPKFAEAATVYNPEGYLIPIALTFSENYLTLLDTGTGQLAVYKGQY